MRICMFAVLLPAHITGGMEIHSLALAIGIASRGHDVTIITSRHPEGILEENIEGVRVCYSKCRPTSRLPLGMHAWELFEKLHNQGPFDIIHSQSKSGLYYIRKGLFRAYGIPLVTTMHGTTFAGIKSHINRGFSIFLIPKILFLLANHYINMRNFVSSSDAVIAISREIEENMPKEFGISPEKIKTVYNGIDTKIFTPYDSPLGEKYRGKKIILSASVLHRQKGIQYLIRALGSLSGKKQDIILLIAGRGEYEKSLRQLVQELKLGEKVVFLGNLPNNELPDYYNIADIFVMPTVAVEGLPLVLLEAMACEKPVVASDIGGIPTVISDRENGLLIKPGDAKELGDAISLLLNRADLAKSIGENARRTIVEGFSRDIMVEKTLAVYSECIHS